MVPYKKGNPQESFNLAEDIQEGFDELDNLPSRLERYAQARTRALVNLTHIDQKLYSLGYSDLDNIGKTRCNKITLQYS